jgi:hypothetical protein
MKSIQTAAEVVKALGGIKATAALTGRKYNAAANWPVFGHFPSNTYVALTEALNRAGYRAPPTLWKMSTRQ